MMKVMSYIVLLFLSFLALSSVSYASEEIKYPEGGWNPYFLKIFEKGPSILPRDFDTKIEPPPVNDSDVTIKELAVLRDYKNIRTEETIKKIKAEIFDDSGFDSFQAAGLYDVEKHPKTQMFMEAVSDDLEFFIAREKKKYARPRPTQLSEDLEPVIRVPLHAAYPSGHATTHYFSALVLSELNPSQEEEYKQFAKDVAHRREIAGLHYPSDSASGQKLAQNFFNELLKNEEVKALLDAAREEY